MLWFKCDICNGYFKRTVYSKELVTRKYFILSAFRKFLGLILQAHDPLGERTCFLGDQGDNETLFTLYFSLYFNLLVSFATSYLLKKLEGDLIVEKCL